MKIKLLSIFFLAACLVGCQKTRPTHYDTFDGFALGTTYHIVARSGDTTGISAQIDSLFKATQSSMSLYNDNSRLSRINNNQTDTLDRHIIYCIEVARGLSEISGGLYDITVKPLTDVWGFANKPQQESPNITSVLGYVGYTKIRIDNGLLVKSDPRVEIDLNSIAKGYATDLMGAMLESRGIENYLVEIGGEIVCRGENPSGKDWVVGIDRPQEGNFIPGQTIETKINLSGRALATSGNYRRFHLDPNGNKVVHTINPLTGYTQSSNLLSATVIADNCALADGWATMLMVAGVDKAKQLLAAHPEMMGYLIYSTPEGSFETYNTDNMEGHIIK